MKIVQLTAENIKRIQAVEITPDGAIIPITGRNAQGKSSVLDSIAYALGGKDQVCDEPIRKGQKRAKVICDLGEIIVTRTFTAGGGGTLTVKSKDGATLPSPQAALDKLVGRLSFDPLAFSRMAAKQQAETLRTLVGLDFTKIDADRREICAQRTNMNRSADELDAQVKGMPEHANAPAEEVSAASIMAEIEEIQKVRSEREQAGIKLAAQIVTRDANARRLVEIQRQLDALFAEQQRIEELQTNSEKTISEMEAAAAAMPSGDMSAAREKLTGLEAINRKVRENAARIALIKRVAYFHAESASCSRKLADLDARKEAALAEASFPVPGLSFDENGVSLNGIPFTQASAAEQLRTSVAIGLASNPTLRVLLIRDGSLLDADSLKLIADMAEERDAQIWLEKVSDGEAVGVVIEDGQVLGAGNLVGASN